MVIRAPQGMSEMGKGGHKEADERERHTQGKVVRKKKEERIVETNEREIKEGKKQK
jgi:hypothetical protein